VLFCALSGFLTPLLVDCWSSGDPGRAGAAYAVNVVGCILGPLLAGFGLLPWLGERWALLALSLPLFVIAGFTAFRTQSPELGQRRSGFNPKLKFLSAVGLAMLLARISHDYEKKYPVREVRRDYTATVIAAGKGMDRELLVNGIGMTNLTPNTKYMAHLPLAFMSRPAQNGLVICFGMGTTFRSMLSWGISTTAVDLVPSVPAMFSYFHPDASRLMSSSKARIVVDDGRRFLDGSTETYDVIVVDPPPPPAAPGSSLLYSSEFYAVIKKHLRQNGILQMWYPIRLGDTESAASVAKTLVQSFPYVRAFASFDGLGIHFLASREPLPATSSSTLATRLPPAAVTDFVEWGPESNALQQFERALSHELNMEQIISASPRTPALRDDEPINEYYLLRSWFHFYR
jgi:spermidine synthase